MNKKFIYIIIIFVFVLTGCYNKPSVMTTQQQQNGAYNFASLYNPGASIINPDYKIYLESNNSAKFYFKFDNRELLKLLDNYDSTKQAKLVVKYIMRDLETMEISDSNTYNFHINFNADRMYSNNFNINIPSEKKYRLIVNFSVDPVKKYKRLVTFINNNTDSENKFLVETIDSVNNINFRNFVDSIQKYKISSTYFNSITVQYYKPTEYILKPPYSSYTTTSKKVLPDSTFNYFIGDTIEFVKKGFYIFKDTSNNAPGLCLLNAGVFFPNISTVGDMLEPLKLIATNKEYEKIKNSDNIKNAIDEFWYSKSNNQSFAKEQIRVFYNRIRLANIYFSDNIEGWKTDRGLIYVIFGPPSIVNLSDETEEWYYGENPNIAGLLFVFNKFNNPFSDNSYTLTRDNMYQPVWSQAISTWRKGRVFSI